MDDIDFASDIAQARLEEALKAQASKKPRHAVSLTHCIHCGEEIPERRRELIVGVDSCRDCQELLEKGKL